MNANAFSKNVVPSKDLPISKKSQQWEVKIDKAKNDNPNGVSIPYTMTIKNIGEYASFVRVRGFSNKANIEDNVITSLLDKGLAKGYALTSNFSFRNKANKLIVLVSWTKKKNEKEHQERFVFNNLHS